MTGEEAANWFFGAMGCLLVLAVVLRVCMAIMRDEFFKD